MKDDSKKTKKMIHTIKQSLKELKSHLDELAVENNYHLTLIRTDHDRTLPATSRCLDLVRG
jgi:hypothetical protein